MSLEDVLPALINTFSWHEVLTSGVVSAVVGSYSASRRLKKQIRTKFLSSPYRNLVRALRKRRLKNIREAEDSRSEEIEELIERIDLGLQDFRAALGARYLKTKDFGKVHAACRKYESELNSIRGSSINEEQFGRLEELRESARGAVMDNFLKATSPSWWRLLG